MATSQLSYKMAQTDVHLKWVVIKFLAAAGEKLTCIHKCLCKMCDEETVDVDPVQLLEGWKRSWNRSSMTNYEVDTYTLQ